MEHIFKKSTFCLISLESILPKVLEIIKIIPENVRQDFVCVCACVCLSDLYWGKQVVNVELEVLRLQSSRRLKKLCKPFQTYICQWLFLICSWKFLNTWCFWKSFSQPMYSDRFYVSLLTLQVWWLTGLRMASDIELKKTGLFSQHCKFYKIITLFQIHSFLGNCKK